MNTMNEAVQTRKPNGARTMLVTTLMTTLMLGMLALATPALARPAAPASEEASKAKTASVVVNLNSASVDELMELPGIGATKAEAIVKYRQTRGGFKKVEDLMKVKGIGRKTFQKLKAHLALKGPGLSGAKVSGARPEVSRK